MSLDNYFIIKGEDESGLRLESRVLEENIQNAVEAGKRNLRVYASGQHAIGGRLWKAGSEKINVQIFGSSGQRVGCFGFPNTYIEVNGPASDDVGWLNAGAEIVVKGNAGNGICNAMAQGKVMIAGNIGSRGMTMTKHNPRFEPPELWVLGSTGDYFGEFMAGGKAVICGYNPGDKENILGYRPLVGMVGGKVFFRGKIKGYSSADAKLRNINDKEWEWLELNLKNFLEKIDKKEILNELLKKEDWQLIEAKSPGEKKNGKRRSMKHFIEHVWDKELGKGGLIGDLEEVDRTPVPVIATGQWRRFVPLWENKKYMAPCQGACPSGIPVQERWRLIREGKMDEAVELALDYTPFPAAVCGYLCPNLCMDACTKKINSLPAVDIKELGKASIGAETPVCELKDDYKKIAVIGGGPGGISAAWQLRMKGHDAVIFDIEKELGGKISSVIPNSRIPKDILDAELLRIKKLIPHVQMEKRIDKNTFEDLKNNYDYVIIATGTVKPRIPLVKGNERIVSSLEFLRNAKNEKINPFKNIVVIGGGNVGCDVATEAKRLGASNITIIDIQKPAAFGVEREDAEKAGAVFKWPCFTKEVTKKGILLESGEFLDADMVVAAIGDETDLSFLPENIETEKGLIKTDKFGRTSDFFVFAAGDVVKPGLLTDAIGAARKAVEAIDSDCLGIDPEEDIREVIDTSRVSLAYFDPRKTGYSGVKDCGDQCASCGTCRDCSICVTICPRGAISRIDKGDNSFEYIADPDKCIGCGFCAEACPCGIWVMAPNTSLS
jgi:NADPH-dependent glutamate synthase beta subunit-like oxidoreductase/glutamate synthase domain-containing protein 3/NAD-dependent dihydropyrimidine dehydrogenase PreA subunit